MSFVNDVKSPLDNEEFLKSMILMYSKQPRSARRSGRYIYDALIVHPESEADSDKEAYTSRFKKFVEQDTICQLLTDVLGYSKEDAIRIYIDLFLDGKDESQIESVSIDKEDILSNLEEKGLLDYHYDDKYMQMPIKDILKEVFDGKGTMGYHIHETKFSDSWYGGGSTVKFYINVGEDTYEFSKLFKQKCEERDLSYVYKVVNPENGEEVRADKMCIYTGLRDIETYLEIIREIKQEHPDFDYREPSPIMGSIDEWIGVGADPDNFELAMSYNDSRAIMIENALSTVLGNASEKKIKRMLETDPEGLISKLRAEIKRRAADYLITQHFVFDDVIVDAIDRKPEERNEHYEQNRNKLFDNLPANVTKQSIIKRIKGFMTAIKDRIIYRRPRGKKPDMQLPKSDGMTGTQHSYGGHDEYVASLQKEVATMQSPMPLTQEPFKRDEDTKMQGQKHNDEHIDITLDDDEVWY